MCPCISLVRGERLRQGTRGLVAMTSAQHAEGRQFDPGRVYLAALRNGYKVNAEAHIVRQATLCRGSLK